MVDALLDGTQVRCVTSYAFEPPRCVLNHHHVAIVFSCKSGKVLASGVNMPVSGGSVHAECNALHQLHTRIADRIVPRHELRKGVRMLSLRVSSTGCLRLAKPCAACDRAIRACPYGMRWIEWSDNEGRLVRLPV